MIKENILDVLKARGFVKQVVYEDDLYKLLGEESVPFYIGFDPTADSLHVGHFLALMAMSWMQKAGHKPVVLIGGGTGKIGDPSGRTDMRKMMTDDMIKHNCDCFKVQMSKFFTFEGENGAVMVNNADWLDKLNYIEFIRDIGVHFSVNKMLTAECFKSRMEKGLSFLEFNYMLMQSYDFLYLYKNYGCKLECGGDDQWSNILAGADLIRRKEQKPAFAMTFTLLTTAEGKKMGKTQAGAVWLDKTKTTPYEFYQYWRNIADSDVEKCLKLLTYLDLDVIASLIPQAGADGYEKMINIAKMRLAYEVTKIVHTEEDAELAQKQSLSAFGLGEEEDMPAVEIAEGINSIVDVLIACNLCASKGEARRLLAGGGVKIGDDKADENCVLSKEALNVGVILHKGKKIHIKVTSK
ncbi:MAG: tyrosine--tRNA ligase [Clostridia bacterium]